MNKGDIRNWKQLLGDVPDKESFHDKVTYKIKYKAPNDPVVVLIHQTEDPSVARRIKEALDRKAPGRTTITI